MLCHAQKFTFSDLARGRIMWAQTVANLPFIHKKIMTLPDMLHLVHANKRLPMGIVKD